MKESVFIRQNARKWKEYEYVIDMASTQSPDELADIYTDVTADLAFAQTHYPNSRITSYLNGLSLELHGEIYKGRREKWSRIASFWSREIPEAVLDARKEMLLALGLFLLFVAIGVVSTLGDSEFSRLILGDNYVDMTIDNISNGVPTDVYNHGNETGMFLRIMYNNLYVGIITFAMGVFTPLGTIYMLLNNGVMVGTFVTLFKQYHVFGPSFLAVMQHGTLELSTIVIEGAAGIVMGNGWLFPGTYSRMQSFMRSARRGMKIAISAVPLTIIAAFFEGFLTRHVEISDVVRVMVVVVSAAFVLFYYVYLPVKIHKKRNETEQ